MESERVEVENCEECPFCEDGRWRDRSKVCALKLPAHLKVSGALPSPSWCPLRTGDVLVTLKKGGE